MSSSNDSSSGGSSPSGNSGSLASSIVRDGYMYTLDRNRLLTHDLVDPSDPVLVDELTLDAGLETIFLYDGHIYIGSTHSLYIINLNDRAAPKLASKKTRREELINACDPVVVQDDFAYSTVKIVTNRCGRRSSRSALLVYDISNKSKPIELNEYPLGEPNGLGVAGRLLFVCDSRTDAVVVFDNSNPKALIRRHDLSIPMVDPYDIIINNDKMIISTSKGFNIYNIADLEDIFFVGTIQP